MLFYDDEPRNIDEVSELGANCYLVRNGINIDEFDFLFEILD